MLGAEMGGEFSRGLTRAQPRHRTAEDSRGPQRSRMEKQSHRRTEATIALRLHLPGGCLLGRVFSLQEPGEQNWRETEALVARVGAEAEDKGSSGQAAESSRRAARKGRVKSLSKAHRDDRCDRFLGPGDDRVRPWGPRAVKGDGGVQTMGTWQQPGFDPWHC